VCRRATTVWLLTTLAVASLVLVSCGGPAATVSTSPVTSSATATATPPASLTTSSPPLPGGVDEDRDGIADRIEDDLVARFAPVVRLHPDEQYMPASVAWYLPRVRMRFDVSLGLDKQLLDKGSVNPGSLIAQANKGQMSGLSAAPTDFFLEQTDASGGDDYDAYRAETRKGPAPAGWTCYAHVRPAANHPDMYDIQYIFFYAYNGDMLATAAESAHEADMEHITIRVEKDRQTVQKIYYAAHSGEGRWYDRGANGYSVTADGRPIVYSAINSHASYPWARRIDRTLLPDDETREGGVDWDCRQNVANLGEEDRPRAGMQWLQYSGRWGEIGETDIASGPLGPAYQSWWTADPE
jgi:hypothetical protein